MKLLSHILAPVCCVTVAEGTQLWKRFFSIFLLPEKEKKEKNSRESGRAEREEVMCQQKPVPGRKIGAL